MLIYKRIDIGVFWFKGCRISPRKRTNTIEPMSNNSDNIEDICWFW